MSEFYDVTDPLKAHGYSGIRWSLEGCAKNWYAEGYKDYKSGGDPLWGREGCLADIYRKFPSAVYGKLILWVGSKGEWFSWVFILCLFYWYLKTFHALPVDTNIQFLRLKDTTGT